MVLGGFLEHLSHILLSLAQPLGLEIRGTLHNQGSVENFSEMVGKGSLAGTWRAVEAGPC
jgi:hypothetical protein